MKQFQERKIKMLAFDIDGTLLNGQRVISERTLEAIKRAMAKGIKVCLVSGRVPQMMKSYAKQIGFSGPYAAANGAILIDNLSDQVLFSKPLATEAINGLTKFYEENGLEFVLLTNEMFYYSENYPRLPTLDNYNNFSRQIGETVYERTMLGRNLEGYKGEIVNKTLTMTDDLELFEKLIAFLENSGEFSFSFSEKNILDITAMGTDKGMAVEKIAAFHKIPTAEVAVMGDFDNDLAMFKMAGMGIAMGNASENLLAEADYITDTNDNEGVAKAIEKICDSI